MDALHERILSKVLLAGNASDNSVLNPNDLNCVDNATKIDKLVKYIDDLQKASARSAFTLVLIDGDGMNFHHDLVAQGIEGGEKAANRIMRAALHERRHEHDFCADQKIFVKVYANLKGLYNAYAAQGTLPSHEIWDDFVMGFNKVHPSCEIIHAGNAKEGADTKIRENLRTFIYNVHCRHIILGASTDNTYASYLKSFYDFDVPSKVRLLEGPPFAFEFRDILSQYKTLKWPGVFMAEKLPHARSPKYGTAVPAKRFASEVANQRHGAVPVVHRGSDSDAGDSSPDERRPASAKNAALVYPDLTGQKSRSWSSQQGHHRGTRDRFGCENSGGRGSSNPGAGDLGNSVFATGAHRLCAPVEHKRQQAAPVLKTTEVSNWAGATSRPGEVEAQPAISVAKKENRELEIAKAYFIGA